MVADAGGVHAMTVARAVYIIALMLLVSIARVCFAQEAEGADTDYRLNNGLKIPGTDINVGSYGTASLDNHPDTAPRLAVDALSLFVWWDGQGRWKFFSELEYENLLYTESNAKGHNGYLSLERLYAEYALTDSIGLRAGKFLTPIGRWNEIHATPLVWTTSRPLATQYLFPDNMTGVTLKGSLPNIGRGIDYTFYASNGDEIRPNPVLDPFRESLGTHIVVNSLYGTQFGFSYVSFEQERSKPTHNQLLGGDFLWTHDRFEVMAEAAYRRSDAGSHNDEWGGYVQFVAPLSERLYGVARYENLHLAQQSSTTQLRVAGLNYKLSPHLILKIEWASSRNNRIGAPDGLLSSISVLL
jgi:hypothetical protein